MRDRILLIEANPAPRGRLAAILTEGGYSVAETASTEQAMDWLAQDEADLIVFGRQAVGFTTLRFCAFVRGEARFRNVPLALMSDALSAGEAVALLRAGVDVHLSPSLTPDEILAHVRALFRRVYAEEDPARVFERGGLALRAEERRVLVKGRSVNLTRKEFELLRTLMSRPQKVFSFQSLLKSVWGYDRDVSTKTLQVHVTRLRNKLGPAAAHIKNSFGVGYVFSPEDDEGDHP